MKRFVSLAISLALVLSFAPVAFAASNEATQAAQSLYDLGLFQGTGNNADGTPNFDLDRTPTRAEAVTMLVRLLGKETEAKNGTWKTPFTDVADWAKPYVGYAYANGLTTGTSGTTFGGTNTIDATQYLTLVLRALGYKSGTDFQWNKAWELSDKIGLTDGRYSSSSAFTRGDIAITSYQSLNCTLKDQSITLFNKNIKAANTAPDSVKTDIISKIKEGMEATVRAYTADANGLRLLSEQTNNPTLIVLAAQQCQQEFANANGTFSTAITLCGDYEDTQTVKNALKQIVSSFSALTSYTLTSTPKNVVDFLLLGTKIDTSSYVDTITAEIEIWKSEILN